MKFLLGGAKKYGISRLLIADLEAGRYDPDGTYYSGGTLGVFFGPVLPEIGKCIGVVFLLARDCSNHRQIPHGSSTNISDGPKSGTSLRSHCLTF